MVIKRQRVHGSGQRGRGPLNGTSRHPEEEELELRINLYVQPEQEKDPKIKGNVDCIQSRGHDGNGGSRYGPSSHTESAGAKDSSNVKKNSSCSKSKNSTRRNSVTLIWT